MSQKIKVGDRVKILSGPHAGMTGILQNSIVHSWPPERAEVMVKYGLVGYFQGHELRRIGGK